MPASSLEPITHSTVSSLTPRNLPRTSPPATYFCGGAAHLHALAGEACSLRERGSALGFTGVFFLFFACIER